ncbi:MAG: hypothetical protein Q9P01_06210 [Anaerolineae bacterium]|nr:hypothetical protein [Anaerolineae bacterium]MDQ7034429.1 hypothetical protein [Anaerolineae bacterium]
MSNFDWSRLDPVILSILENNSRQFFTAYQLALLFKEEAEELFNEIGLPIGGLETGERNSLARTIATRYRRHSEVEYAELSDGGIDITFRDETNTTKKASKNDGRYSLFRSQNAKSS